MTPNPTPLPANRDLLSHHHIQQGEFPKSTHLVVFEYPDCTRTFDGMHWTVTPRAEEGLA